MIYGVVALLAVGLISAVVMGIIAVRTALVAEENLQAFLHAQQATMEYIQQNNGQWPKSWDDLRKVHPESDFDWVADHLTFDFNADPNRIISQTPDKFAAIKPNDPCYVIDDEVDLLIKTLKQYHDQN